MRAAMRFSLSRVRQIENTKRERERWTQSLTATKSRVADVVVVAPVVAPVLGNTIDRPKSELDPLLLLLAKRSPRALATPPVPERLCVRL